MDRVCRSQRGHERCIRKLVGKPKTNIPHENIILNYKRETGLRSRYSDLLQAGRPKDRSSRPCRSRTLLLSTSSLTRLHCLLLN
jgi:hypothetical protein